MNKAGSYIRVSSSGQDKFSPEAQRKLLQAYVSDKKNGLKNVKTYFEVQSAKKAGREKFNEMLSDFRKGEFENILVEKTDRLYRNPRDWVIIDDLIENHGLIVHLVKENEICHKNAPSHQKFIHGIKVLMAKNFLENLSEEIKKGHREKLENGGFNRRPPLGYKVHHIVRADKIVDRTIKVDKKKAPKIEEAFRLYATGDFSLSTLAERLNKDGLRTQRDNKIQKDVLGDILQNPFYIGQVRWGKDENGKQLFWAGQHTPLIDKETFDRVKVIMEENSRMKVKHKRTFNFSGLMRCKYCGSSISAGTIKGAIYYFCTKWKAKKNNRHCPQKSWKEEAIEKQFSKAIDKFHLDAEIESWLLKALKNSHKEEERYIARKLTELKKQKTRLENHQHQLYDDKLNGVITVKFFKERFIEVEKKLAEVNSEIKRFNKADIGYIKNGVALVELLKDLKSRYQEATPEIKNRIFKVLIEKVTLKDKVQITWQPVF